MDEFTPTSVYQYFDRRDVLLYVGITGQRSTRNTQHNRDKAWWPHVHSQEVDHFPTRAEALAAEKRLIQKHRPPFNTQHNPDKGELGVVYLAYAGRTNSMPSPGQIMQLLRGRLPLEVVKCEGKLATLRSLPEHYSLASRVMFRDDAYLLLGNRRSGRVSFRHDQYSLTVEIARARDT